MRGRGLVLVVALLVAGCSGFDTGSVGDPAHTSSTSPPGVGNGVTNASALITAHERSFTGTGAVIVTTSARRSNVPDVTNRSTRTTIQASSDGVTLTRERVKLPSGSRRVSTWRDGVRGVQRSSAIDGPSIVSPTLTRSRRYRSDKLGHWLSAGEYSVVATEDGTPRRYILTGTGYQPADGPLEADTVQFQAEAVVTSDGRVTAFTATLVTVVENKWGKQRRVRSFSYRVRETGAIGVTRPEWISSETPAATEGP
ncbi:MAG: hypothetical protein ABEH86_00650 [Haloarcula sp.]